MEFEPLLRWLVGLSCLSTIVLVLRVPGVHRMLMKTSLALLGFMGIAIFLVPSMAGYLAAGAWLIFYVVPIMTFRHVMQKLVQHRYRDLRWMLVFSIPMIGVKLFRQQSMLISALSKFDENPDAALAQLEHLGRNSYDRVGRDSNLWYLSLTHQWQLIVKGLRRDPTYPEGIGRDSTLILFMLRALGELGEFEELLKLYETHREHPLYQRNLAHRPWVDLMVLSYLGKEQAVNPILEGPLAHFDNDTRMSFQVVASARAGDKSQTDQLSARLRQSSIGLVRYRAELREENPLESFDVAVLSSERKEILNLLESEVKSYPRTLKKVRPQAVLTLMLVLVIFYGTVEFWGEGSQAEKLLSFGALIVAPGHPGTSFFDTFLRAFLANYLHLNLLHLGMNLAGLWIIGRRLEAEVGGRLLFWTFFLTGPLAAITLWSMSHVTRSEPFILVGASGAVMGLIGAVLGLNVARWRVHSNAIHRQPMVSMVMVIVLQFGFDLTHPEVSLGVHLSGALWGVILALVFGPRLLGEPQKSEAV